MKIIKIVQLVTVILIIACPLFYWFQYRPSKIKHECSWIKEHVRKVAAVKPMSAAEVEENYRKRFGDAYVDEILKRGAINTVKGGRLIPEEALTLWYYHEITQGTRGEPGRLGYDKWRKADPKEYSFCIHDKGL